MFGQFWLVGLKGRSTSRTLEEMFCVQEPGIWLLSESHVRLHPSALYYAVMFV